MESIFSFIDENKGCFPDSADSGSDHQGSREMTSFDAHRAWGTLLKQPTMIPVVVDGFNLENLLVGEDNVGES